MAGSGRLSDARDRLQYVDLDDMVNFMEDIFAAQDQGTWGKVLSDENAHRQNIIKRVSMFSLSSCYDSLFLWIN